MLNGVIVEVLNGVIVEMVDKVYRVVDLSSRSSCLAAIVIPGLTRDLVIQALIMFLNSTNSFIISFFNFM